MDTRSSGICFTGPQGICQHLQKASRHMVCRPFQVSTGENSKGGSWWKLREFDHSGTVVYLYLYLMLLVRSWCNTEGDPKFIKAYQSIALGVASFSFQAVFTSKKDGADTSISPLPCHHCTWKMTPLLEKASLSGVPTNTQTKLSNSFPPQMASMGWLWF